MTLSLYNTMTRRVEPFVPQSPPRVTLYSCGPTVYNYAHIGNFRTFLFVDLLRRWLEASGYDVFHIMNLTDVDDKIIRTAAERGITIDDLVTPFIGAFFEDRDYLKVVPAHAYPRATAFIEQMIRLIAGLLANGTAYRGDDGSVYFGIDRFPAYGRLSQLDRRSLKTGASGRVSADEYDKENAQDFVLWKAARPEDEKAGAAWDSPFGRGRPGWHLECSAMALAFIGERYGAKVLDIHTGGVDLIFPHHEDEIAQSCAYTGEEHFARYWLHGEFLNIRGAKMSKRFGNITTPRDLREDGVEPAAIRLLVYQTHYRQQLDLTDDGLAAAREGARRLGEFADRFERAGQGKGGTDSPWAEPSRRLEADFRAALDDDLNAPQAVGAVFEFVREANRLLDEGAVPTAAARAAWDLADRVLAVAHRAQARAEIAASAVDADPTDLPETPPSDVGPRLQWAIRWASRRATAKRNRQFPEADRIRTLLVNHQFDVRDRRDGSAELIDRGA
ncbi:MAG: cysteine--tRNA ligase [Gemmatimonadales bacterium]|nr:cysteine--tRNA ligase [Gemmatimonadales bacterium]